MPKYLCGADGWVAIETYGKAKEEWLSTFLDLPNGIPSHDTFGRIFSQLEPEILEYNFQEWIQVIAGKLGLKVVAIDGKSLNGSYDRESSLKSLVMVSAWSDRHKLVLGQVAVEQKSNEIKAIPLLLEQLDLKGAIITMDAMGTQTAIARQINSAGADYILTLKANHPTLAQDARNWWEKYSQEAEKTLVKTTECICEAGHHRIEKRCFISVPADQVFDSNRLKQWKGLQTLIVEQSSPKGYRFAYRQLWNKTTYSTRFFLSSLACDFTEFPNSIRSHWGVENQLHWCLDVIFSEDASRIRKDHAPQNMTLLKRLAFNLLRQDTSSGLHIFFY
ncbi:ISAs1 family transposase [Waterburya agarophytonicola K14]|uniref:ISAs1 family transposase n=1 Tax=Waterburya agarophytonicola KI4 TaxID=2874699 RepID=A0A964FLH3_9CYAN|nr:ISAs1 family transposase [Waterburya agarophytonicola]MCC0179789.1 ISAs1 family transposase [Waterburya agarophytonicola KI4]